MTEETIKYTIEVAALCGLGILYGIGLAIFAKEFFERWDRALQLRKMELRFKMWDATHNSDFVDKWWGENLGDS